LALAGPPVIACGVSARKTALTSADGGNNGGNGNGGTSNGGAGNGGTDEAGNGTASDSGSEPFDSTVGDAGVAESGESETGPAVICPDASLAAGDYTRTLTIDGGARTYYVHVPPGLSSSSAAPLVFAFHGGGQTALEGGLGFESFAHVRPKSDSSGFVLIEPEGTPALPGLSPGTLDVWNAGNCCELAEQKNDDVDDVGFVAAMIDSVSQALCIDPKRVFATGFSNGGMLAHRLACQLSDRIAAITAVSGGMGNRDLDTTPVNTLFPCTPGRQVPILHIHGTQDACYPFDGGWGPLSLLTFEAVMVTIDNWVARNGCGTGNPTTVLTNGAATCNLYPCPKAGEVEFCMIDGGGHYWPGGDDWTASEVVCGSNQGIRSADLIANDAFWSWFLEHPMP